MPLFAASVALVRRRRVLLIQRARPPSAGYWTLPGGRLEPGETAEACAAREVREELGLAVFGLRPVSLITVRGHGLQVFATEGFEGEIVPDPAEVRQWRWVGPSELPVLRTTLDLADVMARTLRLFDRR
jgi:ADP-ribose pyrophosphatase YjhB (NUDIX family)